jgi:hypothetical protein
VIAGAIAVIALVALMLRPQPPAPAAAVPCPEGPALRHARVSKSRRLGITF